MYALLVWGYDCNRLVKIQKKIIRNICCEKYNAHTEPLFKRLELLKLDDTLVLNTLKFYYKFKNDKVPEYFKSYTIQSLDEKHGRNTRYKSLIPANQTRLILSDRCLRNNISFVLNATPQIALDKTSTHSFHGYSTYIKNMMINSYSNHCTIQNCYVCGIRTVQT